MPSFGVTDTGFILPSQQTLLDLVVADEKATINPNVDTSSDSVIGQLNGVFTRQLMIAWESLQVAYGSNDPDAVEGFLLTQLAKLTGTPRLAATQSQCVLTCTLTAGTSLIAGTTLAAVAGNPASQWTPKANYTATFGGAQPVTFVNIATGVNLAPAGTITIITTPVTGWTAVTNPADALPGTDIESDSDLRFRRELELQGGGAGNVDAMRAALLEIVGPSGETITTVNILNNVTDLTDANGVPPHCISAIIYEAGSPVSNNTIAQTLWDSGAAGIGFYGALSGTAIDKVGASHTVAFSRVTQVPIYLAFSLTPLVGYSTDLAFKSAISVACHAAFGGGVTVDPYTIILATAALNARITGLSMGLTAPAGSSSITSSSIAIGPLQIANFDTTRITVNGV